MAGIKINLERRKAFEAGDCPGPPPPPPRVSDEGKKMILPGILSLESNQKRGVLCCAELPEPTCP